MYLLFKAIAVAGIAVFELWAAIPAGFVFGLPPVLIGIVTIMGGISASILVVTIGGKIKKYIQRKREIKFEQLSAAEKEEIQQRQVEKKNKQQGKIYKIWDRFGIIGLGLLAPIITGVLIGSTIVISLGVSKKRIILWVGLGVVMWTGLLVSLASLGIDFIFYH